MAMDYRTSFGLAGRPFLISAEPDLFVATGEHRRVLRLLTSHLASGSVVACIEGLPGTGKTILIRKLARTMAESGAFAPYASLAADTDEGLVALIARRLGLPAGNVAETLWAVEQDLAQRSGQDGGSCILMLDNAHRLSPSSLGQAHALQASMRQRGVSFVVLLAGRPELARVVGECPAPIRSAIASETLKPLQADDQRHYIEARLSQAGWTGRPALGHDIGPVLQQISAGVPRTINHVMSRALSLAAIDGQEVIDSTILVRSARSIKALRVQSRPPLTATTADRLPAIRSKIERMSRLLEHQRAELHQLRKSLP
jgi:type II secretory pathway predicted ATPase ExeA